MRSPDRCLCIYGHFYQPPRENPFTGVIARERGAEPYANFNEKINAECYRPNAELGNFRWLSFDLGPTLTGWLDQHDRPTLERIVAADRWAVQQRGAGAALAQGFHHTILPLDSPRDQRTQVRWGVREFQFRFGRQPFGLWLPETAVDLASLEALAAEGIAFTVLAPWQAANPATIETGRPYQVALPSGRSIAVFFYDATLSSLVSFHPDVTVSAPRFVEQYLLERYPATRSPHLLLIASDGELYGHHHPFRDLFLQDLFTQRLTPASIQPVTLEDYLRRVPERPLVTLQERTSWSCHHGIERWRGVCDCSGDSGGWKSPLRGALDAVRTAIDGLTEEALTPLLHDVWAARNDYIEVILATHQATDWLERQARRALTEPERQRVGWLMEAQRYRLAMYASCGYYWEELDRLEPGYAIANALQAIRLTERATDTPLKTDLLQRLTTITSPRTGRTAAIIVQPLLEAAEAAD